MKRLLQRTIACLLTACAVAVIPSDLWASPEPIPPLMGTLMEIFPERNGWFVEEPLGAVSPETDKEAARLFEQPRVIVPGVDDIQEAIGRLFAASSKLPIRKIRRCDEKPGVEGLPAFRGIWCETENKGDIGFAILTTNQNRFLLWAQRQYLRAVPIGTIPGKIRDWYARSASQYLASLDFNVPDNQPPQAASRSLPDWLDLFPAAPQSRIGTPENLAAFLNTHAEIGLWGWHGFTAFIPTAETIDRFINEAPVTLYPNKSPEYLQHELRDLFEAGGSMSAINSMTAASLDTLATGRYLYAVDRYGRVRIASASSGDSANVSHALLFPGAGILAAGWFELGEADGQRRIRTLAPNSNRHFYSPLTASLREDVTIRSNEYMITLGHFFAALRAMGIAFDGVLIRKF